MFQALRIAVNHELDHLQTALSTSLPRTTHRRWAGGPHHVSFPRRSIGQGRLSGPNTMAKPNSQTGHGPSSGAADESALPNGETLRRSADGGADGPTAADWGVADAHDESSISRILGLILVRRASSASSVSSRTGNITKRNFIPPRIRPPAGSSLSMAGLISRIPLQPVPQTRPMLAELSTARPVLMAVKTRRQEDRVRPERINWRPTDLAPVERRETPRHFRNPTSRTIRTPRSIPLTVEQPPNSRSTEPNGGQSIKTVQHPPREARDQSV